MKTLKTLKTILLILCITGTQLSLAQDKATKYSDAVTDNPTADQDLKIMADFTNALVHNDMAKVESLLSDAFVSNGPSVNESQTKEETITIWNNAHKARTNQKVEFVMTTFKVLEGNLKGNWVSQWGIYTFTVKSVTIVLPYQSTARIANGKIEEIRTYYDNLAIARAMGFEITAPKKNKQ